jgi:hypothetical protein
LSSDLVSLQTNAWDAVNTRLHTRRWKNSAERSGEPPRDPDANEFLFEDVPAETYIVVTAKNGEGADERQDSLTLYLEPGERREIEWQLGLRSSPGRIDDWANRWRVRSRPVEDHEGVLSSNSRVGRRATRRKKRVGGCNGAFSCPGWLRPYLLDVRCRIVAAHRGRTHARAGGSAAALIELPRWRR